MCDRPYTPISPGWETSHNGYVDGLLDLTLADIEGILFEHGLIEAPTRVKSVAPVGISASGLMGAVTRLHLEYDPPEPPGPPTLILKTPTGLSALGHDMSRVEVHFYADRVAQESSIHVPAAYYCRIEEPLLLLEDVGKDGFTPQIVGCSEAQALKAIGEIAKLHARWWNAGLPKKLRWIRSPLDSPAGRFCAHWLQSYKGDWPAALGPAPEILRQRYEEIGRRLAVAPFTVVHGDFHSENVSFDREGNVTLIDFHRVERATGMLDVARFLATSLEVSTRRTIEMTVLREYLRCLGAGGVTGYDMNGAIAGLRPALFWILASPLALHIRGIAEGRRTWPSHFPILERCLAAIQDWDALSAI